MRFGLICRTRAFQIIHAIGSWGERIGLLSWAGARALGAYRACLFFELWRVGLRAYFQTLSDPIMNYDIKYYIIILTKLLYFMDF